MNPVQKLHMIWLHPSGYISLSIILNTIPDQFSFTKPWEYAHRTAEYLKTKHISSDSPYIKKNLEIFFLSNPMTKYLISFFGTGMSSSWP